MNTLKRYWAAHGTKILGSLAVIIGAGGESLALIQAVDPKHAALWALVMGLGGAVVRRGFTNSAQPLPAPDPNASRP
jgi:hypothetical protein